MSEQIAPVVIPLDIPRDIHTVWRAWTRDVDLADWFWSQWPDTNYELRAEQGGEYHYHSESGQMGIHGRFTTFQEPSLLVMSWDWDGDGSEPPSGEELRVELAEQGRGTRMTLTHTLADEANRAPYQQAWDDILRRLAAR